MKREERYPTIIIKKHVENINKLKEIKYNVKYYKRNYMRMRGIIFMILLSPGMTIPISRSIRINYKVMCRRTTRIMSPLYNRMISYHSDEYTESVNKNIRVNYKLVKRKTEKIVNTRTEMLLNNQNEIIDRSVSIISDNVVNEFLYIMKVYHITNDNINSYAYIMVYEFIWTGYKIFRINTINPETKCNDRTLLYQQVVVNILLYIVIKNLILNSVICTLNNQ